MQIHSKLPNVGTTIFTVMSGLAAELNAVNLGQGFPDYPMDGELTRLVNQAMNDDYNQYAPMPGWLPLREAIAEKNHYLYAAEIDPVSEITITPRETNKLADPFDPEVGQFQTHKNRAPTIYQYVWNITVIRWLEDNYFVTRLQDACKGGVDCISSAGSDSYFADRINFRSI